jgi:predicted permease
MFLLFKALVSGGIIAGASELAKKFPLWGAVFVSIPMTSLMTAIWMHIEKENNSKISDFLENVFWAHIPTLLFFVLCPALLRAGMGFWLALSISLGATCLLFMGYAFVMKTFGIQVVE